MSLSRENLDFRPFLMNVIERFEMNAKDSNIHFIKEVPEGEFTVWIDPDRMTQVLDNIISNAIKYSPDGGNITVQLRHQMTQIDRKSTRLNSSHVAISYAVFCLKKKNKNKQSNEQH